jgi:hypothetical protein
MMATCRSNMQCHPQQPEAGTHVCFVAYNELDYVWVGLILGHLQGSEADINKVRKACEGVVFLRLRQQQAAAMSTSRHLSMTSLCISVCLLVAFSPPPHGIVPHLRNPVVLQSL